MSVENRIYYANFVQCNASVFDFMFNFGVVLPKTNENSEPEHVSSAVVVMSPQHAKAMAEMLRKNIEKYEEVNGEIVIPANLVRQSK